MKNNVPTLKGLKNVYITACKSGAKSLLYAKGVLYHQDSVWFCQHLSATEITPSAYDINYNYYCANMSIPFDWLIMFISDVMH